MADAYRLLLALHIVVAFAALAAFWVAVLLRKGSDAHRTFGGVFVYTMGATAVTAAGLCAMLLIDPLAARPPGPEIPAADVADYAETLRHIGAGLLEVSLATGALLHFGLTALRRRGARLRRPWWGAVAVAASTLGAGALLFVLHSDGVLLTLVGGLELRALLRRERHPAAWLAEHVAGMVGAGGMANAAFAVNVARRMTDDLGLMFMPGGVAFLIFAAAIGVLAWKVRRGAWAGPARLESPRGMTPRPSQA